MPSLKNLLTSYASKETVWLETQRSFWDFELHACCAEIQAKFGNLAQPVYVTGRMIGWTKSLCRPFKRAL